jgi:hypothetical protein
LGSVDVAATGFQRSRAPMETERGCVEDQPQTPTKEGFVFVAKEPARKVENIALRCFPPAYQRAAGVENPARQHVLRSAAGTRRGRRSAPSSTLKISVLRGAMVRFLGSNVNALERGNFTHALPSKF